MAFGLRYGSVSPFNSHVTKLAEALCKGFKVRFVKKMPQGAMALCDLEKKEILLPALDPSKLNEVEGQKIYAYSAHERKHAMLSTSEVFNRLTKLVKDSKEKKESRSVLITLTQVIEDCRIEMNKNYSMPGDMEDLSFCRSKFCEELCDNIDLKAKNPIGYIICCFQYKLLSEHPAFSGLGSLPSVPTGNPAWQEMYDIAMKILSDGRFEKALNHGQSHCEVSLNLALDIEAAWQEFIKMNPQQAPNSEGKEDGENGEGGNKKGEDGEGEGGKAGNGEGNSDKNSGKFYSEVNELYDAMNKSSHMEANAFSDAMDSIMDDHGILDRTEPAEEGKSLPFKVKVKRDSPYLGFNIHDREIIAKPDENVYKKVCEHVGPQIAHVRDMLAVYLKSLTQSNTIRHLRTGKLDQKLFYKTAKGIENKYVFKQHTRGEDFSVAVSIVIDLSGSMGCSAGYAGGRLSPSGLSMQMAILLAEVFNLLEIPFEIVGFNTDSICGYDNYGFNSREDNGFRHREYINYWIFKSFDDNYMAGDTRYRLGSITGRGCNVDHEVIYWAAGRLWRRNTKRKLQIVLSDGQPSGFGGNYNGLLDSELIRVNQEIVASGIEQFAFGLQSTCVKEYYQDYLVLNNIDDLNIEALQMFAKYLLEGKTK